MRAARFTKVASSRRKSLPLTSHQQLRGGTDEGRVAALVENFWDALPARDKHRILSGADAWCVPSAVLARHLEPMLAAARREGSDAPAREARSLLLAYAACLDSEEPRARRAVAAALSGGNPERPDGAPAQRPLPGAHAGDDVFG